MDKFTIDTKFLCSIYCTYGWDTKKSPSGGTTWAVDHPAFAELRNRLESTGYIKTCRTYSNGDTVLNRFTLNDLTFHAGDRFPSAAAQGNTALIALKANQRRPAQMKVTNRISPAEIIADMVDEVRDQIRGYCINKRERDLIQSTLYNLWATAQAAYRPAPPTRAQTVLAEIDKLTKELKQIMPQ